jgi:hypothetical protein
MRRLDVARTIVRAALVASLGAIAGVLACSFIISDKLPAYVCVPNSGPGVCPAGQVCAPNGAGTQYSCAAPCTPVSCASGLQCDSKTGLCAMPDAGNEMMMEDAPAGSDGPDATMDAADDRKVGDADAGADADAGESSSPCSGFGCACATSSDCPPRFACAGKVALTTDVWNALTDAGGVRGDAGSGVCVEPCCISSECDSDDGGSGGQVCFATGAGGNYCVPPAWLGDRSTIGTALGGAACADDAGAPCRSGLCVSGACADTCCSSRLSAIECAGGSICRFAPFPGAGFDKHETATCAPLPASARTNNGSGCASNSECKSNFCSGGDGGVTSGDMPTCREPCRNASDCAGSTRSPPWCGYLDIPMSTDLVSACMPSNRGVGDAGGGSPCQLSSDCARGYCAPLGNGRSACLATCFIDRPGGSDDCLPSERCRPQPLQVGTAIYSVLACGM